MHQDQREFVRRLFEVPTEIAEPAHEAASAGQSTRCKPHDYLTYADKLRDTARDLAVITEAALIVSRSNHAGGRSKSTKRRCRKSSTSR